MQEHARTHRRSVFVNRGYKQLEISRQRQCVTSRFIPDEITPMECHTAIFLVTDLSENGEQYAFHCCRDAFLVITSHLDGANLGAILPVGTHSSD